MEQAKCYWCEENNPGWANSHHTSSPTKTHFPSARPILLIDLSTTETLPRDPKSGSETPATDTRQRPRPSPAPIAAATAVVDGTGLRQCNAVSGMLFAYDIVLWDEIVVKKDARDRV
ncbi:hypothetical protein AKJ16_DCAP13727 [Drosera capensis]